MFDRRLLLLRREKSSNVYRDAAYVGSVTLEDIVILLIQMLLPKKLLRPSTVFTRPQPPLQILITNLQRFLHDKPPNALRARRRGETALISPQTCYLANTAEVEVDILVHTLLLCREELWELREETVLHIVRGLDTMCDHTAWCSVRGVVDEVHLALEVFAVDEVFGWVVGVPASEVGCFGL